MSSSSFSSFDVKKYMSDTDVTVVGDLITNFVVQRATNEKHRLSFDEIVKILNALFYNKDLRDYITKNIYTSCHPN
jgi:hypothetical protein